MSPTIYDIARVASVSKSTVSRVLNKKTNISPQARDKVLKAMSELNYHPNKAARALTSSGFDAIMVIYTRPTKTTAGNPYFSEALHAITAKAEEEGFDVILQTSLSPADELQKCESKIMQKMIKGIIMLSSPANELFLAQLDKHGIPVVVIGKVEGQYANVYSVDTDNYQDSVAITNALIKDGHKNIACLHAPLSYHVSVDRVNGYKASLQASQLPLREEWIIDGGYMQESALDAARALLSLPTLPDAVFATDSLKLMSVYRAAAEKNIRIPQQLTVVGYLNETLSFILNPPPGGIDVPSQELGAQSFDLIFKLISGKKCPRNVIVETTII